MALRPNDDTIIASEITPDIDSAAGSLSSRESLVAGRYEIVGLLGTGGMGTVYRARDLELEEFIALKVLNRNFLDNPDVLERFKREVRLARKVTHRNVARVFDIGEHDGEKFLTMELIEGESLSHLLSKKRSLEQTTILKISSEICEGLNAAHEAGVVHRDLKPDNILIANDNRSVITDFGIARPVFADGSMVKTIGVLVGTPMYMSPEQVEGLADLDGRTDIYSLGVILYELFTGKIPWAGDSVFTIASARLNQECPDPRNHNPRLTQEISDLIQGCMQRHREKRFQTAYEVLAAITLLKESGSMPSAIWSKPTPTAVSPFISDIQPSVLQKAMQSTAPGVKTVAVLPFRNLGPAEDEYLADGLTEDLIDVLSMTDGLRVRPRGTVMRYKDSTMDHRAMGAELDVHVVIEGSIAKSGDKLRVKTRLISVKDGFQLWAKRFQGSNNDALAINDEVAEAVAVALSESSATKPIRRAPTDPRALDLYFRGKHLYHSLSSSSAKQSVDFFEQALLIAPDDPMILTATALARVRLWFFGGVGTGASARLAAERAIAVAPERGDPYVALAAVQFQNCENKEALQSLRRALILSPSSVDAHELLGRILSETGPADLAKSHLNTAIRLDPTLQHAAAVLARLHVFDGNYDRADALLIDSQELTAWLHLGRTSCWRQDPEYSKKLLTYPIVHQPGFEQAKLLLDWSAHREIRINHNEFFTASMGTEHASARSRVFLFQIAAEMSALSGQINQAMTALQNGIDAGFCDIMWMDYCPAISVLKDHPSFETLRNVVHTRALQTQQALRDSVG
jgi:eukaryotic-like serine/threonine-protein kinase